MWSVFPAFDTLFLFWPQRRASHFRYGFWLSSHSHLGKLSLPQNDKKFHFSQVILGPFGNCFFSENKSLLMKTNKNSSAPSGQNLFSFWGNCGGAKSPPHTRPISLCLANPPGPGHQAAAPLTCNLDVIDGDDFVQLQQKLLGEGGQAGYEGPAAPPGAFLEETGAQCWRQRLWPQKGAERGPGEPASCTRPEPCAGCVPVNRHLVPSQEASPDRWLGLKRGSDSGMAKGQLTQEEMQPDVDLEKKFSLVIL